MNANLIFKWLRDARFAPGASQSAGDGPCFLPVEIAGGAAHEDKRAFGAEGQIEVKLVCGHRLRVSGSYDPEALARLIRGLSG